MPSVVKSAAIFVTGSWAPKNATIASLTGGTGASHLLLTMYVGEGGKSDASWQIPDLKYNGVVATKIKSSHSTDSTGGSQAMFLITAPAASGALAFNTTTDFYVNDICVSYIFIKDATGLGTINSLNSAAKDAAVTTSVAAAAGSMVISHALGVYVPVVTVSNSSPAATLFINDSTTKSDLSLRVTSQDMVATGTATVKFTPQYNWINSISVEFQGNSAPAAQTLTVSSLIGNASLFGMHLAKDPNSSVLAVASIVAPSEALGSHTITRENVVYWEVNGPGNTASGNPAVTVERTSIASDYRISRGSAAVIYGEKKYWEAHIDVVAAASVIAIGMGIDSIPQHLQLGGYQSDAISWDISGGARDNNNGMNGKPLYAAGDTIMVAMDMTQGWLFMGKNGIWYNGTSAGTVNFSSGDGRVNNSSRSTSIGMYPALQTQNITDKVTANFGRSAFAYTPPTGFTGLDVPGGPTNKNLIAPSIDTTVILGAHSIANTRVSLVAPSIVNTEAMGVHSVIQLETVSSLVNTSTLGNPKVVQLVRPIGLTNASSLGSHALISMIQPAGIDASIGLGAPSVIQIVAHTGFMETSVIGDPLVRTYIQLSVNGIANIEILGAHALTGKVMVQPPSINNLSGLGVPSINQIVHAISHINVSVFGSHTLNQGVKAGGLANVSDLGNPVVIPGKVILTHTGILNTSIIGNLVINQIVNVSGIINTEEFGNHLVSPVYENAGIYPSGLINLTVFGQAKLVQGISVGSINPIASILGSHKIVDSPKLVATAIINTSVFGVHTLKMFVNPASINNPSDVGIPNILSLIKPAGILNNPVLGNLRINSNIMLSPLSIVNSPILGTHTVFNPTWVYANGILNAPVCGDPSVLYIGKANSIYNQSMLGYPHLNISEIQLNPNSIININMLGNHVVSMVVGEITKFIRDEGEWKPVAAMMIKSEGHWLELGAILEKQAGVWVQIY